MPADVGEHEFPEARGPSWTAACATLLGLGAFAIAQPLFDVLAGHVPFLVAHQLDATDLVILAAVLCLAPGLLALAVLGALKTTPGRLRTHALSALVGLGVALIVLPPLQRALPAPGGLLVALAIAAGIGVGLAHARFEGVRAFSQLLVLGVVGFPVWFLALSPASQRMAAFPSFEEPLSHVTGSTPVVLVVFDQFPLFTLLDQNEQIAAGRAPHFAALAAESDWFRNATTVAAETVLAVPAILGGRYPKQPLLPTYRDYPQNLFTLLGHQYSLNVVQTLTDLCPAALCPEATAAPPRLDRLRTVFDDLFYLYLHVLLPTDLQQGLPDVGSTWRDFNASEWVAQDASAQEPHKSWGNPSHAFERFLARIDASPRSLHFLHINIPHVPWKFLPSGTAYGPVGRHLYPYPMNGLADVSARDGWALDRALQRHLLQVGYADRLLGELVERLRAEGIWDEALVVVTADHGVTFWPGMGLASADQRMLSDVLNVPLFVKRPGSQRSSVSDENVETIDILPTIADVIGLRLPEAVDGSSLYGEAPRRSVKRFFLDTGDEALQQLEYGDRIGGRRLSVNRMWRVFPGRGPDWAFRIGDYPAWIDRPLTELPVTPAPSTSYSIELENAHAYHDVDPHGPFLPARVTGEVRAARGAPPASRVGIALNGRLWATTRTFASSSGSVGFSAMLPQGAFQPGRNDVDVFVIQSSGNAATLVPTRETARRRFALTEDDSLLRSDTGDVPILPGALVGQINTRGPILSGWARDPTHGALPESVVVFVNGRFYEERDLARARANIAERAHVRDADRGTLVFDVVIPFEQLREAEHPELRVFAISHGVASELDYTDGFAYRGAAIE